MNRARLISFFFLIVSIGILTGQSYAQEKVYEGIPSLVWPRLIDIGYKQAEDEFGVYEKPVFSEDVKSMEGVEIYLPGYMIPFEGGYSGTKFILSALPLNACFFCGVGGPETVIEVHLERTIKYTEKPIEVSGLLKLNDSDPDAMIYVLEEATYHGTLEF